MIHNIKWGDTLSALAKRYNTSVDTLAKANGIANPDLIYAGRTLQIPGGSDSFGGSRGSSSTSSGGGTSGVGGPAATGPSGPMGKGSSAFEVAKRYLGRNAGDIKLGGDALGRAMQDWVPNNVNCANFVSAALITAGQLPSSQGSASVMQLMGNLDRNPNYQRVSLKDAKPGDVVSMKTPGGQHVVMFAGWKDGKPQFIGSNNVNPDRSQRVTYSGFNYPIMAIHHYKG